MFFKRQVDKVDDVNEEDIVYIYVPFGFEVQAQNLGAQKSKCNSKWFSYKSNPNLQKLVDIFHKENFYRCDFLLSRIAMKANIKTAKDRIQEYQHAEFSKNLEEHIKRAIANHGEWTDEDKKYFIRWFHEFSKLLEIHINRAIDHHGEWTDKHIKKFYRWFSVNKLY